MRSSAICIPHILNEWVLLRYGANVNSMLKTSTALIVAAAFGSESVIHLLLAQEDIDVNR